MFRSQDIVRINHYVSESVTVLSLKGVLNNGRYLNRLRPRLLSDVRLLDAIGS